MRTLSIGTRRPTGRVAWHGRHVHVVGCRGGRPAFVVVTNRDVPTVTGIALRQDGRLAGGRADARHTRLMRLELTKRADYGVRAMLALTDVPDPGVLSVRRIADAMDIPVAILPRVMGDLARCCLVVPVTGRTGGYRLARPADQINLLEVIEAIEGDSRRQTCVLRGGPCGRDGFCAVHLVFFAAQEALLARFAAASLATLAAPASADRSSDRQRIDV
jgi:Rrf2 family transcriptional regulator, iron-sulfur cluster assembly transcription factor